MDLLALLAQNYIRWRHGLVGAADKSTFDATESALTEAAGQDVSTLDDAAIVTLFTAPAVTQDVLTTTEIVDKPNKRVRKDSGASSTGSN